MAHARAPVRGRALGDATDVSEPISPAEGGRRPPARSRPCGPDAGRLGTRVGPLPDGGGGLANVHGGDRRRCQLLARFWRDSRVPATPIAGRVLLSRSARVRIPPPAPSNTD